jgi:TonB family protein
LRLFPNYAGALYNLGIAYLRLGQNSATKEVADKVKPLNHNWSAQLWQEILASEKPANGVAATSSTPTVQPQPSPVSSPVETSLPQTSPPAPEDKIEKGSNGTIDEECPSPIYRASGVTQMASMKEQLQVPYSADAIQNNVEGKIVLQFVVCSDGRVSDITIYESLPSGLTERAIEAIKKVRFQPALLGTQPVSVMTKQTFACAQQVCTSLSP